MSELFEKRADGSRRREVRNRKENRIKRKRKIITMSVTGALVLAFAAALFINSNYIRRALPAISIGGVSFSAVEFDYFYNNAYMEYSGWVEEQFGEMVQYYDNIMPSNDLPLSAQVYNFDTGETWADFFVERAIANMTELVRYYNAAGVAGFVIPPEGIAQVDMSVSSIMEEARYYSGLYPQQYPSAEVYLHAMFGSSMNERSLRKIMMFVQKAVSYGESMRGAFTDTLSAEQLDNYYNENRDQLDVFSFRALLVTPDIMNSDSFDSDEDYAIAEAAALSLAGARAREIAEGIVTEEDFIAAAFEYDPYEYPNPSSSRIDLLGEQMTEEFEPWLMGGETLEYGSITTIDSPYGTFVAFFIERSDNNYHTVAMRQVLILRDDIDPSGFEEGEEDPEYLMLLQSLEEEASFRAQEAYDLFVNGGATEELFLELIDYYSADNIEGGYYDRMSKFMYEGQSLYAMKVVSEIEDWLFAPGRAYGDFELIHTEAYGYHLVFFMGFGERMRDIIATDRLSSVAFAEWGESLPHPGDSKRHWAFMFTLVR